MRIKNNKKIVKAEVTGGKRREQPCRRRLREFEHTEDKKCNKNVTAKRRKIEDSATTSNKCCEREC